METDDFLRVINEFDFIRDDIDEIKAQIDLTKSEDKKMLLAVENIEKAKNILIELFPSIKSLDTDTREDLEGELDLLFRQQLSGCAEESVSDRATFDVEAEREDGDDYELDLDGDYHFDCELDADELDCRDELGDDWVFEKVE